MQMTCITIQHLSKVRDIGSTHTLSRTEYRLKLKLLDEFDEVQTLHTLLIRKVT